jgi:hypothetical protein
MGGNEAAVASMSGSVYQMIWLGLISRTNLEPMRPGSCSSLLSYSSMSAII